MNKKMINREEIGTNGLLRLHYNSPSSKFDNPVFYILAIAIARLVLPQII